MKKEEPKRKNPWRDEPLIIPKESGNGDSLNFKSPWAWVFLIVVLLPLIAIAFRVAMDL